MHYYFRTSSDPKVIGVRNGIFQTEFDNNCFASKEGFNKYEQLFTGGKISKDEIQIKEVISQIKKLKLMKSPKLTDFLQFSPHLPNVQFLVSERLKNLFENFNISNNQYCETLIIDQKTNNELPYFFFYQKCIPQGEIVFNKSELFTRKADIVDGVTKFIDSHYPIINEEHYNELRRTLFLPNFSKICIGANYINQDYINVSNHAFISEKLKNKKLIDGITGIALNDQCELLFD